MKGIITLVLFALTVSTASALDVHADKRSTTGTCYTWGSGKYRAVSAVATVKTTFDGRVSNYPTGQDVTFQCKYIDEMIPQTGPAGDVYVCGNCYAKTVIPAGETMARTSWPTLTVTVTNDYNTGQTKQQCYCAWDPWAYGSGVVVVK
jgi:hypothetical protein